MARRTSRQGSTGSTDLCIPLDVDGGIDRTKPPSFELLGQTDPEGLEIQILFRWLAVASFSPHRRDAVRLGSSLGWKLEAHRETPSRVVEIEMEMNGGICRKVAKPDLRNLSKSQPSRGTWDVYGYRWDVAKQLG